MSYGDEQPFIDSKAFVKDTKAYVTFYSQTEAMLASLQLYHGIPCHVMDLVFSMVTDPDFDTTQVTLHNSIDIIDIAEESRLKDRMDVVYKRSLGSDGHMEQRGFPQFVLDELLDIIHANRMDQIRTRFEELPSAKAMTSLPHIEEDEILKSMSLVHRSWTFPSQKTLGRVLYLDRPASDVNVLQSHVRKSIFGPWTSVVALQLYHCIEKSKYGTYDFSVELREEYRQWFETLHRILVGFTNLKSVFIQSYAPYFTEWSNPTIGELVRRNLYLQEVTLQTDSGSGSFILDPLIEISGQSGFLKTLNVGGGTFPQLGKSGGKQVTDFGCLKNLTLQRSRTYSDLDLETLLLLSTLSSPCLESLRYNGDIDRGNSFERELARVSTSPQCAVAFGQLHSLHIIDNMTADQWLTWIGPYCSKLDYFDLDTSELTNSTKALPLIPATIRSLDLRVVPTKSLQTVKVADWIKCIMEILSSRRFTKLESFSLNFSGELLEHLSTDESQQQEQKGVLDQLQEFEESMKHICQYAVVEYSLYI